jgi:RimJ/RimL family protein N-acetyltransferase
MADADFTELPSTRLKLRRFQPADLATFCGYRSNPEVARFQSWENFTVADAEHFLAEQTRLHPDIPGTWFQMAIELRHGSVLIGDVGLHTRQDDPRQVEVGITLAPEHKGAGLGTEALSRLLEYVFQARGKHRVSAIIDALNAKAAALLERVGFRREGHFLQNVWFKGAWGDEYSYAILQREWRQQG